MTSLSKTAACGLALLTLCVPPLAYAKKPAQSGADDVVVDERTQKVIESSLKYLASKQQPNGAWDVGDGNHGAAITAYVLVAFMTTGNLPDEGPYGANVRRGLNYLLDCVRPDGYIAQSNGASNMYGHGIATIALAEMYGTTMDESIRPKLERAIKLIQKAQSAQGGWRYDPRPTDSDVSVTVLQVVALRAAKNSGLDVPQDVIDRAVAFIRKCRVGDTGGFSYQLSGGNRPGEPGWARTGAAVYSLQVCGQYDDPLVAAGEKYLFDKFDRDVEKFTYGINYATPASYMIGGDTWRRWYTLVREKLLSRVRLQGDKTYWDLSNTPGGLSYETAVNVTALAMPYGYLPLYQR